MTRHSQCESMTAHYETCILLIEFEEDKFGLRVCDSVPSSFRLTVDQRRRQAGKCW